MVPEGRIGRGGKTGLERSGGCSLRLVPQVHALGEERALELNRDTVGDLDAERGVGGKDVKGGLLTKTITAA